MTQEPNSAGLSRVRAGVERCCDLLVAASPAALNRAETVLEAAVAELGLWRERGHPVSASDRAELRSIRKLSTRARNLLDKAVRYRTGWGTYLGSRVAGYQAGGKAAPVIPSGRLWVQG